MKTQSVFLIECVTYPNLKSLTLRLHTDVRKHVERQLQNEGQEGSNSEAILCQRIDSLSQVSVYIKTTLIPSVTPAGEGQLCRIVQTDH